MRWFREQSRTLGQLVLQALRATSTPESSLIAASIGFYTFFSLFPLTLLVVAVASSWFDPLWVEGEVVTQLEFIVPALGDLLGANIQEIIASRGSVTSVALLFLLWSASNIFNVLTRAMDRVWRVDKRRSLWRHRGLAMMMVLGMSSLLFVASFLGAVLLTILNAILPQILAPLQPVTIRFWAIVTDILLFVVLYYVLPHIRLTWRDVLLGAMAAGFLWELAKRIFLYFVTTYLSRSNLVYGSVATITAFLAWTYVSSIIFLFGGHLNVAYVQWRREAQE